MRRLPSTRLVIASCALAIAISRLDAQSPSQFCPPCGAVGQAQAVPKNLAPEALQYRDWAVGDHGINEGAWQQQRGAAYRLGSGATILQIDTGVTRHALLPDLAGDEVIGPGGPPRSGVDFHGADGFFGIGYSNEDPLLSGFLRFPGHGTKTSSVIAATWPPLKPSVTPSVALAAGGTLTADSEVTIGYAYSYSDDVIKSDRLKKEGLEGATVTIKPVTGSQTIRVTVTGSTDPLVGRINVYAQDKDDIVSGLAGSIPNPAGGATATFELTAKTWAGKDPAPTDAPWRLATASPGDRMRGAAPGARLIPLRATQGVLLIPGKLGELDTEPWRIANALDQAALGERGLFRRRIDVVSMSLGTWPETADLCPAVERATKAGVIVIAAAGNEIKRTKYPAKCPTAIAVAGSNYQQRPWAGSAGSPEVVVAAPAEAVWTASVVNGAYCTEASYGTSFATALLASMAAEWLAHHRRIGDVHDGDDVAGSVDHPGPFRLALKRAVRPWAGSAKEVTDWQRKYGTGIADLSLLMTGGSGNAVR
jgi:hypothetical protein